VHRLQVPGPGQRNHGAPARQTQGLTSAAPGRGPRGREGGRAGPG
jgi:hypothetical protein